jgi:hypothetical protein
MAEERRLATSLLAFGSPKDYSRWVRPGIMGR